MSVKEAPRQAIAPKASREPSPATSAPQPSPRPASRGGPCCQSHHAAAEALEVRHGRSALQSEMATGGHAPQLLVAGIARSSPRLPTRQPVALDAAQAPLLRASARAARASPTVEGLPDLLIERWPHGMSSAALQGPRPPRSRSRQRRECPMGPGSEASCRLPTASSWLLLQGVPSPATTIELAARGGTTGQTQFSIFKANLKPCRCATLFHDCKNVAGQTSVTAQLALLGGVVGL